MDEQRRLIAPLDGVAQRIERRMQAARLLEMELAATLMAGFRKLIVGVPRVRMGDAAPIVRRPVEVVQNGVYHELGVRSFGRGLFSKPSLKGADLTWQKLFRVEEGDLVFSNIKAWEGAFAVAGHEDHGKVGSHRYLTCVPVSGKATSNFLWYYLQTKEGLEQVQAASPGSADRNRTLSQKGLEQVKIPLPSIETQQWFDVFHAKVATARARSTESAKDIGHLIQAVLNQVF